MRWPWTRATEPEPTAHAMTRPDEDERGLDEAHAALDAALSHWPEVTAVADQIRGIRRRNHLADKAYDAMGGHSR